MKNRFHKRTTQRLPRKIKKGLKNSMRYWMDWGDQWYKIRDERHRYINRDEITDDEEEKLNGEICAAATRALRKMRHGSKWEHIADFILHNTYDIPNYDECIDSDFPEGVIPHGKYTKLMHHFYDIYFKKMFSIVIEPDYCPGWCPSCPINDNCEHSTWNE